MESTPLVEVVPKASNSLMPHQLTVLKAKLTYLAFTAFSRVTVTFAGLSSDSGSIFTTPAPYQFSASAETYTVKEEGACTPQGMRWLNCAVKEDKAASAPRSKKNSMGAAVLWNLK